jgi:hypothetical protein
VALPDERERVDPGHRARAGGEVGAGEVVVDRRLEAHLDAADRLGEGGEAEQVDLGVVVDGDARELLDGAHQRGPARLRRLGVDPCPVLHPAGDHPLRRQRLHGRVRSVDLVGAVAGDGDVGVARDREGDGGPAVLGEVQQDDRVRVEHARVVAAGVQLLQHLRRQRVALDVGAAVDADEQDVQRAAVAAAADDVRGGDAGGDVAVEAPRDAGEDEDSGGRGRGGDAQAAPRCARWRGARGRRSAREALRRRDSSAAGPSPPVHMPSSVRRPRTPRGRSMSVPRCARAMVQDRFWRPHYRRGRVPGDPRRRSGDGA